MPRKLQLVKVSPTASSLEVQTCVTPNENIELTSEHDNWLTALMEDDVESVRLILARSRGHAMQLLEGWISDDSFWKCWSCKESKRDKVLSVRRPLSMAAVCGSCQVIEELYKTGINILQVDSLGNNVIHSLIIRASRDMDNEIFYLNVFQRMVNIFDKEAVTRLLLSENSSGLRPAELAAFLQTFRLMNAVFLTPGVYVKKQARSGTMCVDYYDVTDYECTSGTRPMIKSPMFLLILLKSLKLRDDYTTKMLTTGLIGRWIETRKQVFVPFVFIWALLRLLIILLALIPADLVDPVDDHIETCGLSFRTTPVVEHSTHIVLVIMTTTALIFDVYDLIKIQMMDTSWRKIYFPPKGERICRFYFYRAVQWILKLFIAITCINRLCWHFWGLKMPVYPAQLLFISIMAASVWSIRYFIQLSPVVGVYVMATQRMLCNLAKFGIIILLFYMPFAIVFPKFIVKTANGTCPHEFNSAISTFYTSFTTILNMNSFHAFETSSLESLWLVHVLYITIVAILLLNFLIAIFSESYTEVANNPEVVSNIQWMSVIALIDFRMARFMRSLTERLKRNYFIYEGDRIYVKDFRLRCD